MSESKNALLLGEIVCPKCEKTGGVIHHGFTIGKKRLQNYKCKLCKHFFNETKIGKTDYQLRKEKEEMIQKSLEYFRKGVSKNAIARHFNLANTTIARMIKPYLKNEDIAQNAVNSLHLTEEKIKEILEKK